MTTHNLEIRYSKDGGRNWSNWRVKDVGTTGDYMQRAQFLRLGSGRQYLFEIRDTSPYRGDVIAASIHAESE